jgi:hypothetical protein
LFAKAASIRDGDGDGRIFDGTPQERPVGYDSENQLIRFGITDWDGTPVPEIADMPGAEAQRAHNIADRYVEFDEFGDPQLNTPVGRMYRALRNARRAEVGKDYELKFVPIDKVKPTQSGEDYSNPSSENTAQQFRDIASGELAVSDVRQEDLNPIIIDSNGFIVDGNHRHAAHRMTGAKTILALVPKPGKNGRRQITNAREFYEQMKRR